MSAKLRDEECLFGSRFTGISWLRNHRSIFVSFPLLRINLPQHVLVPMLQEESSMAGLSVWCSSGSAAVIAESAVFLEDREIAAAFLFLSIKMSSSVLGRLTSKA